MWLVVGLAFVVVRCSSRVVARCCLLLMHVDYCRCSFCVACCILFGVLCCLCVVCFALVVVDVVVRGVSLVCVVCGSVMLVFVCCL